MRYAARALPLAVTVTLLAGCGSTVTGSADRPSATEPQAPHTSTPKEVPSTQPTPLPKTPGPSLTTNPSGRARPVSVLGTVSSKQGKCLLFTPGDRAESWVLTGQVDGLSVGKGYALEGAMDDTVDPTCQKWGPTFIVVSATPAR